MMPPKGKLTKRLQRAGKESVCPGGWEGTLILPYTKAQAILGVQI